MEVSFVAGFGPIVRDVAASRAFWGAGLGIELKEAAPDYWTNDDLEGVKAFALWPLNEAAESCFGTNQWLEDIPAPQAWIEFDVASPAAVVEAVKELEAAGHRLLKGAHEEPWGQTTSRLLSPEGLLVGVTYTPWMHNKQGRRHALGAMNTTTDTPNWKVLLIGGSSGVGKTVIAPQIARRFGAWCSQVDDFRLAFQRLTTPDQQPGLHFFVNTKDVWQRSPEELCKCLIKVGHIVSWSLEIVVAHHIATDAPLVLEGDGIVPMFAAQLSFAGLDANGQVCSVFLFEPDEDALFESMKARKRGFEESSLAEQRTQARASWLYGQWLRQEAEQHGLPVLEPRPWATLIERILAATN